jgi:signal transduction histidine kinase
VSAGATLLQRLPGLAGFVRSRILRRILLGFALVAGILGVGLLVVDGQMERVSDRFLGILTDDVAMVDDVESLIRLTSLLQNNKRGYVLTGEADFLTRYRAAHDALRPRLRRARASTVRRPGIARRLDRVSELIDRYVEDSDSNIVLVQRATRGEVTMEQALSAARQTAALHTIDEAIGILDGIHDDLYRAFEQQRHEAARDAARSRGLAIASMVTALAAALVYGARVASDIGGALATVRDSLEATGRREPTRPLRSRDDEIGDLYRAFETMAARLDGYESELRERMLTQQRTLGELRQTNDALERAMRVKSDFLATMSHELRTPLNAVIGLSALLLDSPTEQLSPRARQALETMRASGNHLLTLLNDILDLAKVEAGKLNFREELIEPTPLARACLATVNPLVGEKPIELRFAPAEEAGLVRGDPVRVRQILLNLLSNAVKYTDRGAVSLTVARDGDRLLFEVADTGIGIDPDHFEVLFEEFRQIATGDARRYGGTGLGLALSRRMARAMGGDIAVTSRVGQGSTFTLAMPAVAPRAPGAAHAA